MGYVLELQFDSPSEAFVKNSMQRIKDMGLPSNFLEKSITPHLTLLSSETMLSDECINDLDKLLGKRDSFSLQAVSLGTFANEQGVLFLGVTVTRKLLDFHRSVYSCVSQHEHQLHPYYIPDRWIPHVTVASQLKREQLAQVVARLELLLPQELFVPSLALVKYPSPLERLKSWALERV